MKKKDIKDPNVERLSNKDYRKALRRAKRTKRAAAKAAAAEAKASIPKTYDVLIQFDKRNYNIVSATLKAENLKTAMLSSIYAWIRNASPEILEKVRTSMSKCSLVYNGTTYKVRVSAMRSKEWIQKEPRLRKPTNNTDEVRAAAKKRRKEENILRHKRHHEMAVLRKEHKIAHIVGRKAKLYTTNSEGKIFRFVDNRGLKPISLHDKKLIERAKKAGRFIIKQEERKAVRAKIKPTIKPNKKVKNPRVIQTEFKLAA